ncbi:hypothetical protein A2164_00495 [Candidatus Curtissbacteria bacterium RBG_13_35_7]|uniref:Uncharacterized protein n=1 Tax=Candidatus Curtissbacteria bacterium RBG_13_35_7 TaxID=1797705 RepID=A0A1F5G273_9BACT|nr:MAG: hypothetical protein A2164_00495 [Candidatus Curtissbacteria bacterium RBG_13_35_7]
MERKINKHVDMGESGVKIPSIGGQINISEVLNMQFAKDRITGLSCSPIEELEDINDIDDCKTVKQAREIVEQMLKKYFTEMIGI